MTGRVLACLECGAPLLVCVQARGFCDARCRAAWNNRRKLRGAELYDLYMAHRWERAEAAELGVFQAINRLASEYRAEDRAQREGRRSWRRPGDVLAERPYLKSIKTQVRGGR